MKLPLDCIECRKPKGPLAEVGADHAGYICDECYRNLQIDEDIQNRLDMGLEIYK